MALIYKFNKDVDFIPKNILAGYTLRSQGVSKYPYDCFNLGDHVGDNLKDVLKNRLDLENLLGSKIIWMNQTHSKHVALVENDECKCFDADGLVTTKDNLVLAVMTADCLPVLLFDDKSKVVSAIHCGWKGLCSGIVSESLKIMRQYTDGIICALLGPCIGKDSYEVGPEFLDHFANLLKDPTPCFKKSKNNKYLCDLVKACELNLKDLGVEKIYSCNEDTFKAKDKFFSYRRDKITGRMASFIVIKKFKDLRQAF